MVVTDRPFSQMVGADLALLLISQDPEDEDCISSGLGLLQAMGPCPYPSRPPFLSAAPPVVEAMYGVQARGCRGRFVGVACPAGESCR